MLSNIYAQLELRFGLLRATTPKYASYSYVSFRPTTGDTARAAQAIRQNERKAKKWTNLNVDAAARAGGATREEIVDKLNKWNDERFIDLRTSGVLNVYRVLNAMPTKPKEQEDIIDSLYTELETREMKELERMQRMLDLITSSVCFSRTLAQHFGDKLPGDREACGHCQWCETQEAVVEVRPPEPSWDTKAFSSVLEACPDRDDPRFLARIAFGISSPRVTTSKLTKSGVFGCSTLR